MEGLPLGVFRRRTTGKLYFETRMGPAKLYTTKIRSVQEGALCFDIARRYWDQAAGRGAKRKAALELNYPDYSLALVLPELPVAFHDPDQKERAMESILMQARAAAAALPERAGAAAKSRAKVQKHCERDVGSRSIEDRSSSRRSSYGLSTRGAQEHVDSAGDYGTNELQKFWDDVCEHINQCRLEHRLKVMEREELERKVKDIKEDSGFISFEKPGSDKFHEHMACFKLLVSSDGKFSSLLEACEQEYMSEEFQCCKLRKTLEGHNLKSIPESLMGDWNTMTGRRRANEKERLPPVLEICPAEEQNSCSMPTEVSAFCAPPTSPLVLDHVMPYGENGNAIPSIVDSDMSRPVASYEFALGDEYTNEEIEAFWMSLVDNSTGTGYRRENEDERPAEVCANSNVEVQFHDHRCPDWTDTLFDTDQGYLQSCEFFSSQEVSVCIPQM